jgi:hypothetical protein
MPSWNPAPVGGSEAGVTSFDGRSGAVTLLESDIASAIPPGAAGNVLTSTGTAWASEAPNFSWYNVEDYGVQPGNAGSVNATALLALIDTVTALGPQGGTLFWPAGLYQITNVVGPVSQVPIGMFGSGEGITVIQGGAHGICLNFQQPCSADGITFDGDLTASCMLQMSTSLLNVDQFSTSGACATGPVSAVAAASNGVAIRSSAFVAGTGVINCESPGGSLPAIPANAPTSGTVLVDCTEGDLGVTATVTYTGISGNQLTGCTLVATVGNGLLITGNQIQWPVTAAGALVQQTSTAESGATVTLSSVTGVAWGMGCFGPGVAWGSVVSHISGDVVTLINPAGGTAPAPSGGAYSFFPTNVVRVAGNITGALTSRGAPTYPANPIGTVGGVGANVPGGLFAVTPGGSPPDAAALSGYFQAAQATYDGTTYTWVPVVTSNSGSSPLYPDQTNTGKDVTIGTGFNPIFAHTIGKCTFINQPSLSATAGPLNLVDYAAINIHTLLCQGGAQPAGFFGNRYQIEYFKADSLTSGPGNVSLEIEGLNFLNVTNLQVDKIFMNYSTGGAAFGQSGNVSLRVGPNWFGCDNVHIGEIIYDIGPPTSQGITVSTVSFNATSNIVTVTSGGFPGVSIGDTIFPVSTSAVVLPSGTTVTGIGTNSLTLSAAPTVGGIALAQFTGPSLLGAYKDSLVVTKSGGALGRTTVGMIRINDPFYCAGPLFLQGSKVQIGTIDTQPGSPAFIQTASTAGGVLNIGNGIINGIQVVNASGFYLDLGTSRIYGQTVTATGPNTTFAGTGFIAVNTNAAPAGSLPMTIVGSGVIWDALGLPTGEATPLIFGANNLTLDAHISGGAIENATILLGAFTMTGAATATGPAFSTYPYGNPAPGMAVSCPSNPSLVPAGTTLIAISGTTYTFSQALGTGTANLQFQGTPQAASLLSAGTFTTGSRVFGVAGLAGLLNVTPPSAISTVYGPLGVDSKYTIKANAAGTTDYYTGTMGSNNESHIPGSGLVDGILVGAGDTLTVTCTTSDYPSQFICVGI